MIAHSYTIALQGLEARLVDVQCHLSSGLPAFTIVGLPDKAVGESKERVRSSLTSIGLALPAKRITINLAPADMPKEGGHFDLPIALSLLSAMEAIPHDAASGCVSMGELGLDGALGESAGALPGALKAAETGRAFACAMACGPEAALVGATEVLSAPDLLSLLNHFNGKQQLSPPKPAKAQETPDAPDLRDVRGQESAKRALEVAAAGGHNLLMIGPPGAGKSMLAARLPGILPPLNAQEALDVSMIRSVASKDETQPILTQARPFRAPHHSASMAAIIGGGRNAKPGEISLAHRGVLFLDELPEFARPVLEALRQPLELGEAVISRANAHVRYPARIQLIAAMNPCRCGYLADPAQACSRAPKCGLEYQAKLSGPLLDRIDLQIETPAVSPADLALPPPKEGSAEAAARILQARAQQAKRYAHATTNAEAEGPDLEKMELSPEAAQLLTALSEKLRLSARGYTRVLRVARTIADLSQAQDISRAHIAEAASYRRAPLTR